MLSPYLMAAKAIIAKHAKLRQELLVKISAGV